MRSYAFKLTENIDVNINKTVFDNVEASRSTHASNIKISKNRLNNLDFENAVEFLDDDVSNDVNEDVACYIVAHQLLSIIMNEFYRTNLISMIPELRDGGSFMKLL